MSNKQPVKLEEYDACWRDLSQHLVRDAIIVLNGNLSILKVAESIANDDSDSVNKWIAGGVLLKPNQQQIKDWSANPDKLFQCVIIQPYVLIKELAFH